MLKSAIASSARDWDEYLPYVRPIDPLCIQAQIVIRTNKYFGTV